MGDSVVAGQPHRSGPTGEASTSPATRGARLGAVLASTAARTDVQLAALVLLALLLRAWGLGRQSLSSDEIIELGIAKGHIGSIVWMRDGFPPLSQLLLHWWLGVMRSDAAARWLSVVYGVLAVPVMWRLASRLGGARAGIPAALLLAVSPFHVWYSQEGRGYALAFLLALLSFECFFRARETRRSADWFLFALATLAGLYTHYFFALVVLTEGVILVSAGVRPSELKPAIPAFIAFTIAALPLLWLLPADLSLQSDPTQNAPFNLISVAYALFTFVAGYSLGPSTSELHVISARDAVRGVLPFAAPIGLATLLLIIAGLRAIGSGVRRRQLIAMAVIPILVGGLLAIGLDVGFRVRYVAWAAIPLFVVLGAGLSRNIRWPQRAALATLLCGSVLALYQRNDDARYANEDLRGLGAYLRQHSEGHAPVLVISDYMTSAVKYYLAPTSTVVMIPAVRFSPRGAAGIVDSVQHMLSPGRHAWLVYTRPFHGDPQGAVRDSLLRAGWIKPRAEFAGIVLYQAGRP